MIERHDLSEHIARLNQRLDRFEAGGKPMVSFSDEDVREYTYPNSGTGSGGSQTFTFTDDNLYGILLIDVQFKLSGAYADWETFRTKLRILTLDIWYPNQSLNTSVAKVKFTYSIPDDEIGTVKVTGQWMYV